MRWIRKKLNKSETRNEVKMSKKTEWINTYKHFVLAVAYVYSSKEYRILNFVKGQILSLPVSFLPVFLSVLCCS